MTEDLSMYFDKCRCCYASAEEGEVNTQITKTVEKRFHFVSNLEVIFSFQITRYMAKLITFQLKSSSLLSNKICNDCLTKLESFSEFKEEIVFKQEKLYKFLEELRVTEHLEELLEDAPSDNEEVKPFIYETEVDIKAESEYFKQAAEFEYEVYSVAPPNFDHFEAEESSPSLHKKRNRKDPFRNAGIIDEAVNQRKKTENRR